MALTNLDLIKIGRWDHFRDAPMSFNQWVEADRRETEFYKRVADFRENPTDANKQAIKDLLK